MTFELNNTSPTGHTCPKCGYQRQASDNAPAWQCPQCGIAYSKATSQHQGHSTAQQTPLASQRTAAIAARYHASHRLLNLLFLLCASLCLMGWYHKDDLPVLQNIHSDMLQEPLQQATREQPFRFDYRGTEYEVTPVADYELWGVVVTHNDIHGFMDITHDNDSVDIKDICVVWGNNVMSNDYRQVEYHSGDFVCYFRYGPGIQFVHNQLSNSHLLSDDASVRDRISKVNIGDQIHLSGMLVNYRPLGKNIGWRNSSTTRNDTGNGACEVVFVRDFETLRYSDRFWRSLYSWMLIAALGIVLLKLIILYRESTQTIK